MICKYVYTTFKIKCIIAQVFASREKYENKVTKLSRLIVTDFCVLLLFLNFNKW